MDYRTLGRTGMRVSVLGFGCGSVGGLIVRGDPRTVIRAVARAIELGVIYFDTAAAYGDGASESNLGAALAELKADVLVGTKVMLRGADLDDVRGAVIRSAEASLKRLQRAYVDVLHLHNAIEPQRRPGRSSVTLDDVRTAVDAFRWLQERGRIRFWGINGLGETGVLHEAVGSVETHTIQVCYNLLNPSAGQAVPAGFPFQDFERLVDRTAERQIGGIAIRVLAGGALSGQAERHPLAAPTLAPIATGQDYSEDVRRAQAFRFLVQEGYVDGLVEAALRFAISKAEVSTALVGFSSVEQLEAAVGAVNKGGLPEAARDRIARMDDLQV